MLVGIVLALQTGAAGTGTAPRESFDLRRLPPREGREAGEIVVRGQRGADMRFRLEPLPAARFEEPPLRAEVPVIGDAMVSAEGESVGVGPGVVSNRAMVRLKIPF